MFAILVLHYLKKDVGVFVFHQEWLSFFKVEQKLLPTDFSRKFLSNLLWSFIYSLCVCVCQIF